MFQVEISFILFGIPNSSSSRLDELANVNTNSSIDRFLRNVTAGLTEATNFNETNHDLSGTFDDGSSGGGDDSSRTMSGSNTKSSTIRPLVPLRVR